MLSHFISLRIYMGTIDNQNKCTCPCTRQVENPLKTGNGYYRDCVPAAGRICRKMPLLQWTGTRGWSPHRNKLKIGRSLVLSAPDKTQKPWSKWTTSKKHPRSPPQGKCCPSRPSADAKILGMSCPLTRIWWYPDLKSIFEKNRAPLNSSISSSILGMGYMFFKVFLFRAL